MAHAYPMRFFVGSTYNRAAAIAQAQTPAGCAMFHDLLLERSEELAAIPESIAHLLQLGMGFGGPDALPRLFRAIPEGSDLRLLPAIFNYWAFETLALPPPKDFDGLSSCAMRPLAFVRAH